MLASDQIHFIWVSLAFMVVQLRGRILAQSVCVRHACLRAPCVAWPLFSPLFSLSLFLLLFFTPMNMLHALAICGELGVRSEQDVLCRLLGTVGSQVKGE